MKTHPLKSGWNWGGSDPIRLLLSESLPVVSKPRPRSRTRHPVSSGVLFLCSAWSISHEENSAVALSPLGWEVRRVGKDSWHLWVSACTRTTQWTLKIITHKLTRGEISIKWHTTRDLVGAFSELWMTITKSASFFWWRVPGWACPGAVGSYEALDE